MPEFRQYEHFREALFDAVKAGGEVLEHFWSALVSEGQVPYRQGERVAFLFRGEAFAVDWRGDFTHWEADENTQGRRLFESDVWLLEMRFKSDARLDYKIVIDDETWIIDSNNPHVQWSGHGENSALIMPDYEPDPLTVEADEDFEGALDEHRLESSSMGYAICFQVYTPSSVGADEALPTLYTTDGHEYGNPRLGALLNVACNLIRQGRIQPLRIVLVDPRNVDDIRDNRRRAQYIANDDFKAFFTQELVPFVDGAYKTLTTSADRALLGTSLGGLFTTYTGFHHPDVFGKLAIQSPAYKYYRPIYRLVRQSEAPDLRVWLGSGIPKWDFDANRMADILREKGYDLRFTEANQGHSWGQWRDQMSDILTYFFGLET